MEVRITGRVAHLTEYPGPKFSKAKLIDELEHTDYLIEYQKDEHPIQLDDLVSFVVDKSGINYLKQNFYYLPPTTEVVMNDGRSAIIRAFQRAIKDSSHDQAEDLYSQVHERATKEGCSVAEWLYDNSERFKNRKKKIPLQRLCVWWTNNRVKRRVFFLRLDEPLITEIREYYQWGYNQTYQGLSQRSIDLAPVPIAQTLQLASRFGIQYSEREIKIAEISRMVYRAIHHDQHSAVPLTQFRGYDQEILQAAIDQYEYRTKFDHLLTEEFYQMIEVVANDVYNRLMEPFNRQFDPISKMKTITQIQSQAVKMALNSKISIITGGAGSGKTTIINELIYNFKRMKRRYLIVAFTGKAVNRVREVTKDDHCLTIHMTLRQLESDDGDGAMEVLEEFLTDDRLEFQDLIIDEASMVPTKLIHRLVSRYRFDRLILVGDKNQLQPTSAGSYFRELIKTNRIPTTTLTQNHRTREHLFKIVDGKFVENDHFHLSPGPLEKVIEIYQQLLAKKVKAEQIMIITSHNANVKEINRRCQMLNMERNEFLEEAGGRRFYLRDKILMLKNNYRVGQMNGDIGKVEKIDANKNEIEVLFKGGHLVPFHLANKKEVETGVVTKSRPVNTTIIDLGYGLTVHKAQGDQAKKVIFYIQPGTKDIKLFNQCLIYTALTRTEDEIFCVGDIDALHQYSQIGCPDRWDILADWIIERLG